MATYPSVGLWERLAATARKVNFGEVLTKLSFPGIQLATLPLESKLGEWTTFIFPRWVKAIRISISKSSYQVTDSAWLPK